MKNKTVLKKLKRFSDYNLMGGYIKRFAYLYIILLFVVALFELLLFTRELILSHSNPIRHYSYIISYIVLFITSIASAVFLLVQRKRSHNELKITIVIHAYAIIAILWGIAVSLLDFYGGYEFPAVFFTILATVGGLLVLNPFIYVPVVVVSGASIVTGMYLIDASSVRLGNIINITVFYIMIAVISYRTTAVAVSEEEQRHFLTKISIKDTLTGLKNENGYYRYLQKLEEMLAINPDLEFAVILMDCNGLKHTDDTYGHRFGAHVISTAGHILPDVFKNSEIFHTGGDEFVCIVVDEINNLDNFLVDFANTLEYQIISFEGQDLLLSLARGVAIHQKGEKYNDTYQRADKDMYVNKALIKEKHHILGR